MSRKDSKSAKLLEVDALIHNCDDGNAVMVEKNGNITQTAKGPPDEIEEFLEETSEQYDAPILYTESCKATPELKGKVNDDNVVSLKKKK